MELVRQMRKTKMTSLKQWSLQMKRKSIQLLVKKSTSNLRKSKMMRENMKVMIEFNMNFSLLGGRTL